MAYYCNISNTHYFRHVPLPEDEGLDLTIIIAAAVGGAVAIIIVLMIILIVIICCVRSRRNKLGKYIFSLSFLQRFMHCNAIQCSCHKPPLLE